jgi:hypothetical protein
MLSLTPCEVPVRPVTVIVRGFADVFTAITVPDPTDLVRNGIDEVLKFAKLESVCILYTTRVVGAGTEVVGGVVGAVVGGVVGAVVGGVVGVVVGGVVGAVVGAVVGDVGATVGEVGAVVGAVVGVGVPPPIPVTVKFTVIVRITGFPGSAKCSPSNTLCPFVKFFADPHACHKIELGFAAVSPLAL